MSKIKTKLKGRKIKCENYFCNERDDCQKYADAHHHLYSDDKKNRKVYGDLVDEDFNILFVNNDCHINKVIPKLTDIEFRVAAFGAGFDNLPMPKSMQFKRFN
jgi:hypothetical protein